MNIIKKLVKDDNNFPMKIFLTASDGEPVLSYETFANFENSF